MIPNRTTPERSPGSQSRVPLGLGILLVGVLLIGVNLRAAITSVGPVLDDIRSDLALTSVTASVLISLPLVAFAVVSPFAPGLARRFGIERTLGGSLALLGVAIIIRSVPVVSAIWIGTALLGIAIALMNVLLPALVKRDFPDRVGPVTGLYSAVQSGAAAVAAGLAVPIAGASVHGWRLSLGVWAGLALVGLGVFLPRMRARAVTAQTALAPAPGLSRRGRSPWRSAIGWQVTLFLGLQSTIYYTFITWWPTIEQDQGISATAAGWHQFVFQALGIVGSVGAALLIHRLHGQRGLIAALTGLMMIAMAGQLVVPGLALVWMLCAGVAAGGTIVVALSLFGLRTRDHRQTAALSGMAQSVGYLLAASGPILIGMLHDATGSWSMPLVSLLIVLAAQLAVGLLAGRDRFVTG